MGIYYQDPMVTLYQGDVRAVLRELPAESVQTVVTSPPYWSLRDYGIEPSVWGGPSGEGECAHEWQSAGSGEGYTGTKRWQHVIPGSGVPQPQVAEALGRDVNHKRTRDADPDSWGEIKQGDTCLRCGAWRGALGLEPTPEMFIAHMVEVFREVKRVLRKDGTLWLNIGDSYAGSWAGNAMRPEGGTQRPGGPGFQPLDERVPARNGVVPSGCKPKDLVGIPWMLAFALRADGWWLRQDIIWAKPNPMPESVTDRCTKAHEYLFLLSKSQSYYYDADAVREAHGEGTEHGDKWIKQLETYNRRHPNAEGEFGNFGPEEGVRRFGTTTADRYNNPAGRNKRSVWTIATEPFPDAHFAVYPQALVKPCILAGTSERGACAECGAPWERVTETETTPSQRVHNGTRPPYAHLPGRQSVTTTGWRPTCVHADATAVPCTVLDPFSGSGTTALVAKALGRRAVGIDLNAEYLAMSRKRIERVALPMALA